MARFNLEEIAKKVEMNIDELVKKLKDAGYNVDNNIKVIGENEVKSLGLDPRKLQIDKRQDMLKQALERHKRNPKAKEVLIKDKTEAVKKRKITREELLKKKQELKSSLQKVEIEREGKDRKEIERELLKEKDKPIESKVELEKDEVKEEKRPETELKSKEVRQTYDDMKTEKIEELIEEVDKTKSDKGEEESQAKPLDKEKIKEDEDIFEKKKVKSKKQSKKDKHLQKSIIEGIEELKYVEDIEKGKIEEDFHKQEEEKKKKTDKKSSKADEEKSKKPNKITIGENIRVADLSELIGIRANELIKKLMQMGVMANINDYIDYETAEILCADYNIEVEANLETEDGLLPQYEDKPEDLAPRSPVVTVMGHVDHGKTTLLDSIRKTAVAASEKGGITQHIGAYEVNTPNGKITFIDTPGHEAFTSMRSRGANITDVAILVVAADDGVMPQTKEAIDHIRAAGVRMVVAINKIDKANANIERVKSQLAEIGVIPEEWGGDIQFQEISAVKGKGIDELLDKILLEAEILDLKANKNRPAEGIIIESTLDKHRGPVATVLVRNGTLRRGDVFVAGTVVGKVRAMFNYMGKNISKATPSMPVEVMGFEDVADAGERLIVVDDESIAKKVVEIRRERLEKKRSQQQGQLSVEQIFEKMKEGEIKNLNIIIKGDTQGSVEALKSSLLKLSNDEVKINIIHDNVGGIRESDILLASASNAYIIGFNVRPDSKAKSAAEREGVNIYTYSIIYDVIEDVKNILNGMLAPKIRENTIGRAEVRKIIFISKVGNVAGCYVLEGKVVRDMPARVVRDGVIVYEGKVESVKRFKDDVKEVQSGYECGINISKFNDIKEGDIIEVYELIEEKAAL
ncbi:MAG: translation initiation factor IF-2 [Deferribacterota bacterium]|nr:translation initiation factor IF-2 [Deferribacterota bacterium]